MLAALATGNPAAVTVAFSHLLFNLTGTLLIYPIKPLRAIPLAMASWMGSVASRNRTLAAVYIGLAFYGIPLLLLFLTGALDTTPEPAVPEDEVGVHRSILIEEVEDV
jgi:sodium-dependent phosphate cotransporter